LPLSRSPGSMVCGWCRSPGCSRCWQSGVRWRPARLPSRVPSSASWKVSSCSASASPSRWSAEGYLGRAHHCRDR
jgi:hypothetical protein